MRVLKNLLVTMSDGCRLAVDVYLPETGAPCPTVIYMGPYRKDDFFIGMGSGPGYSGLFTGAGYAFVIADARGTNDSEGVTRLMFDAREQRDGYELVEWAARQPWSTGKIGMTGTSYGFWTSLLTAAQRPPHLVTVVPLYGAVNTFYVMNEGGVPMSFGYHADYAATMIAMQGCPPGYRDTGGRWRDIWAERLRTYVPWGLEWFGRMADDEYWQISSLATFYDRVRVPVFAIGGWWDRYATDPIRLAENLSGPTKVLIGPWQHVRPDLGTPGPRLDYEVILRWFDFWLKGERNGVLEEPRFTYLAQRYGPPAAYRDVIPGEWRHWNAWTGGALEEQRWHLDGGALTLEPGAADGSRTYEYDPTAGACSNLTGGIYGGIGMPGDQRADEAKSLVYTSLPLTSEIEVTGVPRVELRFSTSARRMAVVAKLCDVAPDGSVALITRGYLNLAHRDGFDNPKPVEPGATYELRVELKATSYVFERSHRIRLAISSSEFPSVFPTPEHGTNTVRHGNAESPSCLVLPRVREAVRPASQACLKTLPPPPREAPATPVFTLEAGEGAEIFRAARDISKSCMGAEGPVQYAQHTWAEVDRRCPEAARAGSACSFQLEYPDGKRVRSESEIQIWGSADRISVEARLEVTGGLADDFRRTWSVAHPRTFI